MFFIRIQAFLLAIITSKALGTSGTLTTEIIKTYVWGNVFCMRTFVSDLSLESCPNIGFVRLISNRSNFLTIDMVKRPSLKNFSDSQAADEPEPSSPREKFCSAVLPELLQEFAKQHKDGSLKNFDGISVYNGAEPPEAGCKCYVRAMIQVGFSIVNGQYLTLDNVQDFCLHDNFYYAAHPSVGITEAPSEAESLKAQAIISKARIYTTTRGL